MRSTMQDGPLLISGIVRHGSWLYADKQIITCEADGYRSATFGEVTERAERLAKALRHLGVGEGDRVGTFCWNHQEHVEAYLAVPVHGRGAAHPQHPPLPRAARLRHQPRRRQGDHRRRVAHPAARQGRERAHDRRDDHRARHRATATCSARPSTTKSCSVPRSRASTGPTSTSAPRRRCATRRARPAIPKGVVYSHRSTWLHSMASHLGQRARATPSATACLLIVPMFHANGWGAPYTAFLAGCRARDAPAPPAGRAAAADHRRHAPDARPSACRRSGTTCCTRR